MSDVSKNGHGDTTSEGQRRLLLLPGSVAEHARALDVPRTSVSEWRSGRHVPNIEAQKKMRAVYGIPLDAWSTPASSAAVDRPFTIESVSVRDAEQLPTKLEHCMELLGVLRRDRHQTGIKAPERVQIAKAELSALTLRDHLERAQELSEDRYVYEHPAWKKLKRAILRALEAHPAAALAVKQALAALGDGEGK